MSFKKRSKPLQPSSQSSRLSLPPAVRISSENASPITSWGLSSVDAAIGGGLPLGSLTVLTEDYPSSYYRPITSYVIAQGLQDRHAVAIASFDSSPQLLLDNLPGLSTRNLPNQTHPGPAADQRVAHMNIAWRYQKNADPSTHITVPESARSLAHEFDLSLKSSIPSHAPISCIDRDTFSSSPAKLLTHLEMHLQKASSEKRPARIVVQGLSDPFINPASHMTILEFLCRLRALCRVYGCVAVATCSRDVPLRTQAISADALLQLDSFSGRGAGVAGLGKEWLGVLVVKKTYREGRGPSVRGKGDVWVFKRGRRKYTMERATAAPDDGDDEDTLTSKLGRSEQSGAETSEPVGSVLCSSKPNSAYEF